MPLPDVPRETDETSERGEPVITAARSSPDRTVFSEADNPDGWIATDLTVDLER